MVRVCVKIFLFVFLQSTLVFSQTQPWNERIDPYGDLRLRYDASWREDHLDALRYRLRLGLEAALSDAISAGVEIRSGNPKDPVSDNQSFGGGFSSHQFKVSEVFGQFQFSPRFSATAGKFEHATRWVVSDMQWDTDVTVEGFMERVALRSRDEHFLRSVDATIYQLFLGESDQNDAWWFGLQVRPRLRLGDADTLTLGVGFDYLVDPQQVADLTLSGELVGNRLTNLVDDRGQLISDFRILTGFLDWTGRAVRGWSLATYVFFYKNLGARDVVGTEIATGARGIGSENDTAFFFRFAADQGREPGQLRIRFAYYYSEPDALFYAFMQSDTRQSSNLNGTRVDLRIGMPARTYFNVTWYHTKPKLGEATQLNRLFIDYVMSF